MTPEKFRRGPTLPRDDLDKIEGRIRRRWPIIAAKANLPRAQTAEERQLATIRARRREQRRDAGRATLIVACALAGLLGIVFATHSYVGG